ncbi:Hint domain-containing protein [Gluconobacter sp. GP1]|uniref:Hint domain-containing protein n=1 Tax=Gluconobacter sp. GP1 TaxID=3046423 RepID=UPI00293E4C03|nr:Hint domain-containing protein [Gluconobacter sp. GP1]
MTTTVSSGSSTTVSGTTQSGFVVRGGGTLNVSGGGKASSIAVSSGGVVNVKSGSASGIVLSSGGAKYAANGARLYTYSGATVTGVTVFSGAEINNRGGVLSNVTVSSGGFAQEFGNSYGPSKDYYTTVANGGEFSVQAGASSISATVSSGGIYTVHSGAIISGLDITSGSLLTFADFKAGSSMSASVSGSTLNVYSAGKLVQSVGLDTTAYDGHKFDVSASSGQYDSGGIRVTVCYLSNTMILTPGGEKAVETLQIGDLVMVKRNGKLQPEPIRWVGRRFVDVKASADPDKWPVCIKANALADNVPHKDLRITSEHCLHLNDLMVPARMLVNGRSITTDTSESFFEIFHVELETHGVLIADGAEAESYLDTGNRTSFEQTGDVVRLNNQTWMSDAAAPLGVNREQVEPLYTALLERAIKLDIGETSRPAEQTDDHDLHLVTTDNTVIYPSRTMQGSVLFQIQPGVTSVRLVSRSSRPADVIGPFVDDRRNLGVLVGQIKLWDSTICHSVTSHLSASEDAGWYAETNGEARWTNGNALVSLGNRNADAIGMLEVQVLNAGPYLLESQDDSALQLSFG